MNASPFSDTVSVPSADTTSASSPSVTSTRVLGDSDGVGSEVGAPELHATVANKAIKRTNVATFTPYRRGRAFQMPCAIPGVRMGLGVGNLDTHLVEHHRGHVREQLPVAISHGFNATTEGIQVWFDP